MGSRRWAVLAASMILAVCLVSSNASHGAIVNPDSDSMLAEAMALDPARPGDPSLKSRDRAEQKYLEYLSGADDDALICRIYFRLGHLYASHRCPARKEEVDYAKAAAYFEKGLAVVPDAISEDHVRARSMLSGLRQLAATGPKRFKSKIAHYRFLLSLKQEIPIDRVLPVPGTSAEREARQIERYQLRPQLMTNRLNLVDGAARGLDWRERLEEIIAAFPDDQIATLARQAITAKEQAMKKQVIDEVLEPGVSDIEQSLDLPNGTAIANGAPAPGPAGASAAPKRADSVSLDASEVNGRPLWPILIAAIAGTALLGLGALALTRRSSV